jgi:hypothetical protein
MSYYPDMGMKTMIDEGEHIRAVGWLHQSIPYVQGDVTATFLERLRDFVRLCEPSRDALGWGIIMGPHCCEFCDNCMRGANFGVPDGPILFVTPSMVDHYIEVHRYLPPADFISAVLRSPLPDTPAYRLAVEPFRLMHEKLIEHHHRERVKYFAERALRNGGSDEAISEATSAMWGGCSPEHYEEIRAAMSTIKQLTTFTEILVQ